MLGNILSSRLDSRCNFVNMEVVDTVCASVDQVRCHSRCCLLLVAYAAIAVLGMPLACEGGVVLSVE